MQFLRVPEFWVGVGFAAAIAIMVWKGGLKFIVKMLDARAAVIAAELAEARRLREEAEQLLADYRIRADGAEREAESILTEARSEAARLAESARGDLKAQIARRLKVAQEKIAQAEAQAVTEIRGCAADAAVAAAGKAIATRMNEERAGRLVADAIEELGNKLN
ncbi:MAG: F0F1 ATP synthase subunit B [Rhizomicrobium sp.]